MSQKKRELSLLPDKENPNSLVNRSLLWLTSVGRVVIIVTELIVVVAFMSRFWLDRQNSDLGETLRQQKAILDSTKEFEKEYLSLGQRINYIKNFYSTPDQLVPNLTAISQSIPNDVAITSITSSQINASPAFEISSFAYSQESIVNLIVNLSLNPQIKTVEIRRIEKKAKNNKFEVSLSVVMNSPLPNGSKS